MYQNNMKEELAAIIKAVKMRIEMEKRFGVETISLSQQKKVFVQYPQNTLVTSVSVKEPEAEISVKKQTSQGEKERRDKLLEELHREMQSCHKCSLGGTRTNLVFGVGSSTADLMFVGEAPGRDEDLQGEPFVGRAGQLLTKIIEAIGMRREDVYIANILKCRPPGNRNPLPDEIALCIPSLRKQIDIIQPKILCALGSFAAQTLLDTKAPVGTLRGKFHEYNNIPTMVTFHPAYLLRNASEKGKVWEDMKKVRDLLGENTRKTGSIHSGR